MTIAKQKELKLPDTGFLRLNQVLHFIPVGKSTWWAGVQTGRFPKSIKLGPGITVWKAEDIRAYIQKVDANNQNDNREDNHV